MFGHLELLISLQHGGAIISLAKKLPWQASSRIFNNFIHHVKHCFVYVLPREISLFILSTFILFLFLGELPFLMYCDHYFFRI